MYPWYDDKNFVRDILSKKEIYDNKDEQKSCLKNYQKITANYINPKTNYDSILLYMATGAGKTLSSISIAENFINNSNLKILVITKNADLVKNFISELLLVCSNYTTPKEVKEYTNSTQLEKENKLRSWLPRIKDKYIFRHHEELKKDALKGNLKSLSNKVIIIDEIHKMMGNKGYGILFNLLKNSYNYRLVIMSATPVFDNVIDIFQINNLLNIKFRNKQLPVEESELISEYYIKRMTDIEDISIFKDDKSIFSLTQKARKILKHYLKPKLIYIKPPVDDFPKTIEKGEKIEIKNYKSDINLVKCTMSPYQEERYIKWYNVLKNKKDFNRNLEHVSNMIYPDYNNQLYTGNAGYALYKSNTSIFKEENILKYSTKLYNLLQNIKKSIGKICIYSSYVNDDGLAIIEQCLKENGYSSKYISLSGNQNAIYRKKQIDEFNLPSNDNGSKIKILIFSSILAEGVTFKSVREIHIFEPAWNLSSLDQVTGRVIRNRSHSRLPLKDRTVSIFRYCAVPKDYSISSDLSKYIKSSRKDYFLKQLERDLMQTSFLCNYTSQNNLKYSKQYTNTSRECEYQECDYTCDDNIDGIVVDTTTYDISLHNLQEYKDIREKVYEIFKSTEYISIPALQKKLNITNIELITAMRRIFKENKIIVKDNYYIKPSFIIKSLDKAKTKVIQEPLIKNKITMDTDGRIYTGRSKGKICTSYTKSEIIKMFEYAGLPKPNEKLTKDLLCKKLQQSLN